MARATLLFVLGVAGLAHAEGTIASGQCPPQLSCGEVRARISAHRRTLRQMKSRLANKNELTEDEPAIERQIAELADLGKCRRCPLKLQSEAYAVRSGLEGIIAEHFDSWGMKKGEDGRRSFRSAREAARVDPKNLAAWNTYGKALVTIAGKPFKGRIASYLEIDLGKEIGLAATRLRALLPASSAPPADVAATLRALEALLD